MTDAPNIEESPWIEWHGEGDIPIDGLTKIRRRKPDGSMAVRYAGQFLWSGSKFDYQVLSAPQPEILKAWDTPTGPTPEEVYAHTEAKARAAVAALKAREPASASMDEKAAEIAGRSMFPTYWLDRVKAVIIEAMQYAQAQREQPAEERGDEYRPIPPKSVHIVRTRFVDQSEASEQAAKGDEAKALARAVLDLNTGWNAKEVEHLISDRIDLARRLANIVLAQSPEANS